jgi:N-acetylornithine carbamoyltransferase
MRSFLKTTDFTAAELSALMDAASRLKRGESLGDLRDRTMGMVFFNPSLRTRTSFEVGMFQLKGHAVNLSVGQGMWELEYRDGTVMDGRAAEHIKEAAPVLGRYVDILGVRAFAEGKDWEADRLDPVLSAFEKHSGVPVINMESAVWHPCQALADGMTWQELGVSGKDRIVLTWAYHPKALPMAVPNSVMLMAAQMGLHLTVARPEAFALDRDLVRESSLIASRNGGVLEETDDWGSVKGAKIVYAKSWGSLRAYGRPDEEKEIRLNYKGWQVTAKEMAGGARFMHCLPVRRNVVVADEVLDSAASAVVQQAENRLHTQKALLLKLLGGAI